MRQERDSEMKTKFKMRLLESNEMKGGLGEDE